jgi:ABC-type amino acid transport substrate-binding protein
VVYSRPTIQDIASEVKNSLGRSDEAEARRLAFRFVELYDAATEAERVAMVRDPPEPTADARFDALLAGIVDFVCARHDTIPPRWVDDPERFLDAWWFVSGMRTLHADAIAHSPISFARRGVFLTENALTYA